MYFLKDFSKVKIKINFLRILTIKFSLNERCSYRYYQLSKLCCLLTACLKMFRSKNRPSTKFCTI